MAILNLSLLRPELISLQTTRKCGHLKFKMFQNFSKYPKSKAMKEKYIFPLVFQKYFGKVFRNEKRCDYWHLACRSFNILYLPMSTNGLGDWVMLAVVSRWLRPWAKREWWSEKRTQTHTQTNIHNIQTIQTTCTIQTTYTIQTIQTIHINNVHKKAKHILCRQCVSFAQFTALVNTENENADWVGVKNEYQPNKSTWAIFGPKKQLVTTVAKIQSMMNHLRSLWSKWDEKKTFSWFSEEVQPLNRRKS